VDDTDNDAVDSADGDDHGTRCKKAKVGVSKFELDSAISELIQLDEQNRKLWDDVLQCVVHGQQVIYLFAMSCHIDIVNDRSQSLTSTVSYNDDNRSQWKSPEFDPSPRQNLSTNLNQNWHVC